MIEWMKLINFNYLCLNYFYVIIIIIVKCQSDSQGLKFDVNKKKTAVRKISYSESRNENIGKFWL